MSKFAIATFAYSERYQKQVNRMISEIDSCDFKPTVVVVTDNLDNILDKPFVKKYDISQFNPEYKNYSDSYYTFDFSVKRYSLLAALNLGFTKIILSDADAVPNKSLFTEDYIMKGFVPNSIQGQVTYNFSKEIMTNSELGKRFLSYEKYFNVAYDKNQLDFMPEDCIQFIDIEVPKFYNFLRVWDECIKHKKTQNLPNVPAGNIDEMCFAGLYCGLTVGNNSDNCINALTPIHDKWYDSAFNIHPIQINTQKPKKIVTSIYELNYIDERGGNFYKGFSLLTQTIRGIIFEGYEYVIYTDKFTYDKHQLSSVFPQKNVTIKFRELDSSYYVDYLDPIRKKKVSEGEIWDRIHSVKNYIEVIYNKIEFLLIEAKDSDSDIVWIDSGLFGTSCSNGWRDYMNELCHSKLFVDKIFEKIEENEFISLLGNRILINYEVKDKINFKFKSDLKIVPGCLFGGNSKKIIELLGDYKLMVSSVVEELDDYLSEQEILYLLLQDKKTKFFDFDDWDDLQKGILKIIDFYNEKEYDKDINYSNTNIKGKEESKNIKLIDYNEQMLEFDSKSENSNSEIRVVAKKILEVSNSFLDSIDLSHNDYMINKMTTFATLFRLKSGREHYRILSFISSLFEDKTLIDIGTNNGCSAIALSDNQNNRVITYDTVHFDETKYIDKKNISFKIKNALTDIETIKDSSFILLDANQDGNTEKKLYDELVKVNYRGILFVDDINLNQQMKEFWSSVDKEKYDLTNKGHDTGSGIILFT